MSDLANKNGLRLSVVIPCYNAAEWIERTISSALGAGCSDLILVVVDDGSTDNSVEIVRHFGDRVLLKTGPNQGACHARNEGMVLARAAGATHVLFLDADDYLEGNVLAGAADVAARSGADLVLCNMHVEHMDGQREERSTYSGRIEPETFFVGWLNGDYFNPSSILWRIEFVESIGGWDESLARAQDLDITLRAMFHRPVIMKNDVGAAVYANVNTASISRSASRKATESRMKVILGLIEGAKGTSFEAFIPLLISKLYTITRTAFQTRQIDLGRRGVAAMHRLGFRENPGSRMHRIVSNLIGLETKVRLWGN